MRINHNIQALNAYRNLSQTMASTSKSLEKLSSGLRINRAADDAAGLAISEKMRSQIRGLGMAERNALDAVSLIQTAEGALNETHSILQRMRELSIQAANGTLEDGDREAIQTEIDQLTFELDRIADTTQFNQKKLFSGEQNGRAFAKISSNQVAYAGNGEWNGQVTAEPTSPAKVDIEFDSNLGKVSKANIEAKTFTINGKRYEIDLTDGTSKGIVNGNIAVNVTGWKDPASNDTDIIGNMNLLLNALEKAVVDNDSDFTVTKSLASDIGNNTDGNIKNAILSLATKKPMSAKDVDNMQGTNENVSTNVSGVTFKNPYQANVTTNKLGADPNAILANSFTIEFSAMPKAGDSLFIDGLTINFDTPASAYANGTATLDVTGKDISTLLGEIVAVLDDATKDSNNPVAALSPVYSFNGTMLTLGTNKTDNGSTNGLEIELRDQSFDSGKSEDLNLNFQIGANSSETLNISLSIMDAARLGIGFNADGTKAAVGVNAEKGVNVSTEAAASAAIDQLDEAIRLVSEQRSKLGAYQNRLEHTVTNLQTANENLTAAESRIRDLDMALEMTNFTRSNILNQAGQAMLAQANQLPQGILQLLQ
ncbi:flagellin N-terminal helical domain-containing protein [Lederbergia panacisoli]|uniref:flagellin N-terminal helical domain-containing protein n=1 Tax=Lederbergia panacisoli TaxID=1255251 RepID=UPI00214C221D|nr:flagellin [Lederbergia panacisoli]MCR2822356.1 flagellin [Lederbergia panacisoli]